MKTILILNPVSGTSMMAASDHAPEDNEAVILAALREYDIIPEVWHTTEEDPGKELAKKAAAEGADLVIAAGGDGTIHAVAGGLIGTESTLGIIAIGTMNNLARSLQIPEEIRQACEVIAHGDIKRVDVGQINGHVFLEVAGIGLEAALFPAAEEIKTAGVLSTVRGVVEGLFKLFTFRPARMKITFDDHKSRSYHAIQVTICNSPSYGAHLQAAPEALMDDGLLDVVIYKNFSKLEYIRHAISISQGRRILQPGIVRRRSKSLQVTGDEPIEFHADGIPHGHTPASVKVVAGALRVRIPQQVTGFQHPQAGRTPAASL
ncbi:MAG TPA: diacylglycerol kinase family protein [Ktedonosporobacter sp.]|jgi:YegS/Rv2252/BmrU family lipid kinase|nr:diacylglycerol kinase family protein [Ktedonosporobacter sp.]